MAGAFGQGDSAFGIKASDTFTKITVAVAAFWIFLCVAVLQSQPTDTAELGAMGSNAPAVVEDAQPAHPVSRDQQ